MRTLLTILLILFSLPAYATPVSVAIAIAQAEQEINESPRPEASATNQDNLPEAVNSEPEPTSASPELEFVEKPYLWVFTMRQGCRYCDLFERHAESNSELSEALSRYEVIHVYDKQWGRFGFPTFVWPDASYQEGYRNPDELTEKLDQWIEENPPETLEEKLSKADTQSTPWEAVDGLLRVLNPQPHKVLLDPGCGYDARLLIDACLNHGTQRAIGIEKDPVLAESARRHVAEKGLSDRITIITGDSTRIDWDRYGIDIAVCYMWDEVLEQLRPQLTKCDYFVSYARPVPGLSMNVTRLANDGKVYWWRKPQPQPQVQAQPEPRTGMIRKTVRVSSRSQLPGGKCQVCNSRFCSDPMMHVWMATGAR